MYRSLNVEFWTDPKVGTLTPLQRYLFLYCITNPQSHLSGIYPIRFSLIQEETGLSGKVFEVAFEALCKAQVIAYDDIRKVLWVVNMMSYQAKGQKVWVGAANQLKRLHHSSLIPLFLKRYPQVSEHLERIGYQYPIDTPSSIHSPDPISISDAVNLNPEKKEAKKDTTHRACILPDDFTFDERAKGLAESYGLNPGKEFAAFKDHAAANGRVCKDWQAAFRNWLRNSVKFNQRQQRGGGSR